MMKKVGLTATSRPIVDGHTRAKGLGAVRYFLFVGLLVSAYTSAHETDDPILTKVIIDQLERRTARGADPTVLEAQAWIGTDLNKLWLKADVEHRDGETEEAVVQALYSRAVSAFWDLQIGIRHERQPKPTRDWGVLGIHGLAPYFLEVDAALSVAEEGDTALNLSVEYEIMFTQRWVLSPELALTFYGQNDAAAMLGSGFSDAHGGLRLRYEIRREFSPYVGLIWAKKFGGTADLAASSGHNVSDSQWVVGLRAWF